MDVRRWPVTFIPAGVTVWVDHDSTVLEAARRAGVVIQAPCGGRGVCGKCAVRVVEGEPLPPDDIERRGLSNAPKGVRLACRMRVGGPLSIRPVVSAGVAASTADWVSDERAVAGVDMGTTTVSAVIVGVSTGRQLGRATVANAQQSYGADVISRVAAAMTDGSGLREAARASVSAALRGACGRAGACLDQLDRIVIAGNTAMIGLLAGADVSGLGSAPFTQPEGIEGVAPAGLIPELPASTIVEFVPPVGGFVGGDITAGLLAAGVLESDDDVIYVDIGTNAEIVVRRKGRTFFASTAAGPAFEGYGLSEGGPAQTGAVVGVRMADDLELEVVGGVPPKWIAGSGVVSLVAMLLRSRHLSEDGLLTAAGPFSGRFGTDDQGVIRVGLGIDGTAPYITQLDIRAFQTAKAAVASGVLAVASHAGLRARQVDRVIVTGTFGSSLEMGDLSAIGVTPEELTDRAEVFEDAALLGSATVAFHPEAENAIAELRSSATRIELAQDSGFAASFVKATRLAPYSLKKGF